MYKIESMKWEEGPTKGKMVVKDFSHVDEELNDVFATLFELFEDGYRHITIEKKKDE